MSKNRRDQILNMVFGETDTDGIAYESLTEEERAELDTLRTMRDGLKSLSSVPECQLSSERLRGAILGRAVKKRASYGWSFATATMAFIAVALVAFQAGLFEEKNDTVASNTSNELPIIDPLIDLTVATSGQSTNDTAATVTDTSTEEVDSPPAPEVVASRQPTNSDGGYDWSAYLHNRTDNLENFTPISYFPPDEVEITVAYEPGEEAYDGALVVVDTTEDVYGSYEATEVESFGDVVFGG